MVDPAVVAAIELAVGADREAVGAAARRRDDLLLAAGPAAHDALRLDLGDDDAAVVHHHRRLGKAQPVGDQFKLGHILSLACPHLLCFAAIMPVRTLFATNFYEADIGTPDLLAELAESSRLFAEEDGPGRQWRRADRQSVESGKGVEAWVN